MSQRQWMYQIMDSVEVQDQLHTYVHECGSALVIDESQDLSEFMSDAKLRACSCGTEIRLAWKFEKAAPKTTSVIVDPAGLVDTGVVVTQPVVVGTARLVDTASGRWPGGRQPSPCVTSVTSVTSSPTALVTFWLRYLPLSEPHSRSVTSVTSLFPGFF